MEGAVEGGIPLSATTDPENVTPARYSTAAICFALSNSLMDTDLKNY
jgi:hypothetical protein